MKLEFSMWTGSTKLLLDPILALVPDTAVWRVRWFDGVVPDDRWRPPLDCHMDLEVSDGDLRDLASYLEDLNELALHGTVDGAEFTLGCEDSTRWVVESDDSRADTPSVTHVDTATA